MSRVDRPPSPFLSLFLSVAWKWLAKSRGIYDIYTGRGCASIDTGGRAGEGRGKREGWRGRIRASEAEASLLGDYGSLIPIQRSSELHAKRKSHPKRYHDRRERERGKRRLKRFPLLGSLCLYTLPCRLSL